MDDPASSAWILTGSLENFRINVERLRARMRAAAQAMAAA